MQKDNGAKYIMAAFALVKLLIPFVLIHPQFELHRDAYLYLADADHMAWGYIEMPPLLAVLGYLIKLAGGTVFLVHLCAGLFGAATIYLTGAIVLQLKGNRTAVFFACLAYLCSGFLRMNILFQPNFLDVFFWTWSTYLIICWIDTDQQKWLYYLGLSFGLGMLGKYSTAFYILAFLVGLLFTEKRKLLLKPAFYLAMLPGFLLFLPNLLWQIYHHFPVMHHMELLTRQQLQYNSRFDFLTSQLLMAFPSLIVWMGGIWYLLMKNAGRKYILIFLIYIGILSILLYFNGKGYYAAAIYPSLMAFGGIWLSQLIKQKYFSVLKWVVPVLMLGLTYFSLPLILPYRSAATLAGMYRSMGFQNTSMLRWEDHQQHPLPQDFSDMMGWQEMAEKTARIYHRLPDSVQQQTMIYGDNYGEAGALSFYRKKYRLPEIYSDNASFLFWLPDHFTQKYFLFVTQDLPDSDDSFFNHWGKREILDSVTQVFAREYQTKIILYSQPDDSVRIIADKKILEGKNEFHMK
ncbi:MAG: glycosyltransferase family 39 protein [Bacteroidota bacterium]|nr:glycosyltransferase family 39 protein [Bacteroidota bacterium]